jgi:hypothetical protein
MSIQLNHTIVRSRDKHASARFLANILDLPVGDEFGPFVPIRLGNAVTLDYNLTYYAEPGGGQPGHINHRWGRAAYGVGRGGAALVRPDGFLAWRTPKPPPDTHATLRNVLTHLLASQRHDTNAKACPMPHRSIPRTAPTEVMISALNAPFTDTEPAA